MFKPGQSGNPKGRPRKERALTTILEKAGDGKVVAGDKQTRKQKLAEMLWEAAITGKVTFPTDPNNDKQVSMAVLGSDWLDVVQFLYKHIDGPPKAEVDVTSGGQPLQFNLTFDRGGDDSSSD